MLLEQNLLQLLRRTDVERAPGQGVDFTLQFGEQHGVLVAQHGQQFRIHSDAIGFQFGQDFDQRHFDLLEQRFEIGRTHALGQSRGKRQATSASSAA